MRKYEVSITVVRSAVRELKTEGLVYTHQGKGAFVRDPLPPPGETPGDQPSEAFRAVMAEIRSLHDDLDRFDERLSRVERLVLPDDALSGRLQRAEALAEPVEPPGELLQARGHDCELLRAEPDGPRARGFAAATALHMPGGTTRTAWASLAPAGN